MTKSKAHGNDSAPALQRKGREGGGRYLPDVGPSPVANVVYYLFKLVAWVTFPIAFNFKVKGRSNIPLDTGALLVSNHQSFLDPVFLGAAARRRTGYLARSSLFAKKGFFNLLIKALGALPLSVKSSGKDGVRLAAEHLKRGAHIVMFPEGTRTSDGTIGPIQPGAKLIAQKAGVPIIPVAVCGAFEIWPRTKKLFGFGPISVAFGEPLWPERFREMNSGEFCATLRGRMNGLYAQAIEERKRLSSLISF